MWSAGWENSVRIDAISNARHQETFLQFDLIDGLNVGHEISGRVENGHGDFHFVGVLSFAASPVQLSGERTVCVHLKGEKGTIRGPTVEWTSRRKDITFAALAIVHFRAGVCLLARIRLSGHIGALSCLFGRIACTVCSTKDEKTQAGPLKEYTFELLAKVVVHVRVQNRVQADGEHCKDVKGDEQVFGVVPVGHVPVKVIRLTRGTDFS